MHDLKRTGRSQNAAIPKGKKGRRYPLPARSSWDDAIVAPRPPPKATIARGPDGKFRPREMIQVAQPLARPISQISYQPTILPDPAFLPSPDMDNSYPHDTNDSHYARPPSPIQTRPLPDLTPGGELALSPVSLSPISEASPIEEEEDFSSTSTVSEPPRHKSDKDLTRVAVSAWYPGKPVQIPDSPDGSPSSIETTFSERMRRTKPLPDVPRDVDPEDGSDEKDVAEWGKEHPTTEEQK